MTGSEGEPLAGPAEILEHRTVKKGRKEVQEVLVRWCNLPTESATWEEYPVLLARYPILLPEDMESLKEGVL